MFCVAALAARAATARDHANLTADKIGGHLCKPIESAIRQAIFDGDVLAFDVSGFGKTAAECLQERGGRLARLRAQKTDHGHRLLRTRREWPSSRSTN
jgi:hypothetical protein